MKADEDEDEDTTINSGHYQCLPSLVALQQMRNRLHMAQNGKRLMKWSAMATRRELRRIAMEIVTAMEGFEIAAREAFILIARCRFYYPNLNVMVIENLEKQAIVTVDKSVKCITGVKILEYEVLETEMEPLVHLGIDHGGQCIRAAKQAWLDLLKRLVLILQLQTSFAQIDMNNRSSTKKANVLGKIVIPRTELTIKYILSELEEREREEFFRLKKVLEIKYRLKKKDGKEKKEVREECPICKAEAEICIFCKGPMKPDLEKIEQEEEKKADLQEQLDKILEITKEYNKMGVKSTTVDDFKSIAEELRKKLIVMAPIPKDMDPSRLCTACKRKAKKPVKTMCKICDKDMKGGDSKSSCNHVCSQRVPIPENKSCAICKEEIVDKEVPPIREDNKASRKDSGGSVCAKKDSEGSGRSKKAIKTTCKICDKTMEESGRPKNKVSGKDSAVSAPPKQKMKSTCNVCDKEAEEGDTKSSCRVVCSQRKLVPVDDEDNQSCPLCDAAKEEAKSSRKKKAKKVSRNASVGSERSKKTEKSSCKICDKSSKETKTGGDSCNHVCSQKTPVRFEKEPTPAPKQKPPKTQDSGVCEKHKKEEPKPKTQNLGMCEKHSKEPPMICGAPKSTKTSSELSLSDKESGSSEESDSSDKLMQPDLELGVFETDVEEITKIIRKRNPDGTLTEEKVVINITKETRAAFDDEDGNKNRSSGISCKPNSPYGGKKTTGFLTVTDKKYPGLALQVHSCYSQPSSYTVPAPRYCMSTASFMSIDSEFKAFLEDKKKSPSNEPSNDESKSIVTTLCSLYDTTVNDDKTPSTSYDLKTFDGKHSSDVGKHVDSYCLPLAIQTLRKVDNIFMPRHKTDFPNTLREINTENSISSVSMQKNTTVDDIEKEISPTIEVPSETSNDIDRMNSIKELEQYSIEYYYEETKECQSEPFHFKNVKVGVCETIKNRNIDGTLTEERKAQIKREIRYPTNDGYCGQKYGISTQASVKSIYFDKNTVGMLTTSGPIKWRSIEKEVKSYYALFSPKVNLPRFCISSTSMIKIDDEFDTVCKCLISNTDQKENIASDLREYVTSSTEFEMIIDSFVPLEYTEEASTSGNLNKDRSTSDSDQC